MQNRRSLDPEHRTLYGANLQPPAGYVFDSAVATTFSLELETALAVPVSLALFAAENRDELLTHPLALLEGAERIAGRLIVFTDSGQILAGKGPHSRICSLLEKIVVEVAAPQGGAFHPKIWALRFKPKRSDEPVRLRLLILSRNLTHDRSWDIAATFDGVVVKRLHAINRPLVDFVRQLPSLATVGVPEGAGELIEELAENLRHTEWVLPEPFEKVTFAVNGLGGKLWRPEPCSRLGVISPFCDDKTLSFLAGLTSGNKPVFIGRPDEISQVGHTTLEGYASVAVLDEMANTEDGEEVDVGSMHGLHAKAFIAERGWDTSITVGSGNATQPALLSGRNVEIFATLTGKRSKVGGVDEIFGETGFGRLTRPFVVGEIKVSDKAKLEAKNRLDEARREICRTGLRIRCELAASANDSPRLWQLWLVPSAPLSLAGVGSLRTWPITRGDNHAREVLSALRQGHPADLGAMPLADVTRFLAFHLAEATELIEYPPFSTGLAIDGLPSERNAAILRWIIDSKDAFFRYLRLLLSELGDPFAAALAAQEESGGQWRKASDDAPILEEMVRAFCQGGDQLLAIERLIQRLETNNEGEVDPIPAEFRLLWNTFRTALATEQRP
jgi:hypothetical protein